MLYGFIGTLPNFFREVDNRWRWMGWVCFMGIASIHSHDPLIDKADTIPIFVLERDCTAMTF